MKKEFISPVFNIQSISIDKIEPNEYINHVSNSEIESCYKSIITFGFLTPIVCIYDNSKDKYVIVKGLEGYLVMKTYNDIYEKENGMLPVSVIDKPISEILTSIYKHNINLTNTEPQSLAELFKDKEFSKSWEIE